MRLRPISAFCVAVLLLVSGCKVYDPDLVQSGSCDLNKPPPRPAGPDDGMDIGETTYALRDVVFDQDERWREIGYDLDDRCSRRGPEQDVECVPIDDSAPEVDGVGGTDNVFGHWLYPIVAIAMPEIENASRAVQAAGNGAILLRIFDWNGTPNDSRVRVEAAVTVFGTPWLFPTGRPDIDLSGTTPIDRDTGAFPSPPSWEGFDFFWARSDNFRSADPTQPLIDDDNAYIADNVLVVTLPERTDFIFPGEDAGLLVRLTNAVVTAKISDDSATLERVLVAGRWSLDDLLDTASSVGVCPGTALLDELQTQLDRVVDIRSRPGTGGPDVACDAISVGLEFVGHRANFGGVAVGPDLAEPCSVMPQPDAGVSPSDGGT